MKKRNIIINSVILFSMAFLWQTTLHELGHFITAILYHADHVSLYHNYADYDGSSLTDSNRIWIAAAGPLMSLVVGLIFHLICSAYHQRNHLFLFLLYLSAFGYICFAGYLMIAPFFPNGDTGFIFQVLGVPIWLNIFFALLGAGLALFIGKYLGRYFAEMGTETMMTDKEQQKQWADTLIKYPMYWGIVVVTLLNLPVMSFLSLLYPLFNPFNLFWIYGYVTDTAYPTALANKHMDQMERLNPLWVTLFLVTIAINRALVYGFHL